MSRLDYNATILRREELHPNLMVLGIVPDEGEFAPFQPGQFLSVGRIVEDSGARRLVKRAYSIGSSALVRSSVEIFVVHVEDGEFTGWLFAQRPGARIWLSPAASGGFTLQGIPAGRDLVFVATGTAVAPYVSMIRTHRNDPPWRRAVLINGVRYAADLGYRGELESCAAENPGFRYIPMVTREPSSSPWRGMRGRVTDLVATDRFADAAGFDLDPARCHVFLCGNPQMVETLEPVLRGAGFRKHTRGHAGNLHLEKYWAD